MRTLPPPAATSKTVDLGEVDDSAAGDEAKNDAKGAKADKDSAKGDKDSANADKAGKAEKDEKDGTKAGKDGIKEKSGKRKIIIVSLIKYSYYGKRQN